MCVLHKICEAGEWTKATGSSSTDTTCVPCNAGTFREKGPTDTAAEQAGEVCKSHTKCSAGAHPLVFGTATTNTKCSVSFKWKPPGPSGQCDTNAGEVYIPGTSKKVFSLDQCKESCERALGCQSVTFFQNGWCAHFSTPCANTKDNKMAIVVVKLRHTSGTIIPDYCSCCVFDKLMCNLFGFCHIAST